MLRHLGQQKLLKVFKNIIIEKVLKNKGRKLWDFFELGRVEGKIIKTIIGWWNNIVEIIIDDEKQVLDDDKIYT